MISNFPNFKKVQITDREAVETHTNRCDPYSDFNFTSLWAWDTSGERMISECNGNLVVRFTDYSTHEPFMSFFGTNETEQTARMLIDYSKAEGLTTTLKLVPEVSIEDIRSSVLKVVEDRDNFDYVYSIPKLASLRGNKYMSKRGMTNKFRHMYPETRTEFINLADMHAQENIRNIIDVWEKKKLDEKKKYEVENERAATMRLCETADSHELIATGVFIKNAMVAFSIEELLPDGYAICHFWKADSDHAGIFDFLMQEKAKHLETLGIAYINYEQDLGIFALRRAKNSFRPIHFLKKYTVQYA